MAAQSLASLSLADAADTPKVIVLDLDATLWLPEVYTLRAPDQAWRPTLGRDVKLIEGTAEALKRIAAMGVRVAVAPRRAAIDH